MTPFGSWISAPGKLTALFLVVAAASAVALVWTGIQLFRQDRALEAQQLEDRREAAADRAAAALEQTLSAEERRLTSSQWADLSGAEDALLLVARPEGILVWPEGALLYYPKPPTLPEASPRLYQAAEQFEFLSRDYEKAITVLRDLSRDRDPAVRAGAQLRLARNLWKAGHEEAALEVYGEMRRTSATLSGVPADLVARRARCLLLDELGKTEQLQKEAQELHNDLEGGRWRLDRDAYFYYNAQAARWVGQESRVDAGRQALADAAGWLWRNWHDTGSGEPESAGRRSLRMQGMTVAVLWRSSGETLTALVAGPHYQRSRWFDPLFHSADFGGVRVGLRDSGSDPVYGGQAAAGIPRTLRAAAATGLPWDVVITSADIEGDMNRFAQRRQLMMAGLATMAMLMVAASYLIARAVSRELAAARLQSDFVSAVSHEFRTPLTSMWQFTEMLVEDDSLPAEERRAFYRAQERATRRLSRLVESLLDFGRMEAGARPYRLEPLDAAQLVRTVVEEFRQETTNDGFEIECALPESSAPIHGDREALAQALWNLLDNAVKYSGDSRSVQVEVEAGRVVAIRVRDRGLGIPSSEQRQIFRKFARGSSAQVQEVKGTGIGLAMVRHIVDAHGGSVKVQSEPGKGSTFTIELPARG